MGLIADGIVDREGVAGLARRLAYSERHLTRQLTAELGAGPLALARAQRAQTARMLIETTRCAASRWRTPRASPACASSTTRSARPTAAPRGSCAAAASRDRQPERAPGTLTVRLTYREPLTGSGCWASSPTARSPASRRCATGPTGARCASLTGTASPASRTRHGPPLISSAACGSPTCATSRRGAALPAAARPRRRPGRARRAPRRRSPARAAGARRPGSARPRKRRRRRARGPRRPRPAGLRRRRAHCRRAPHARAGRAPGRSPTGGLTHLFPAAAARSPRRTAAALAGPAAAARRCARSRARSPRGSS